MLKFFFALFITLFLSNKLYASLDENINTIQTQGNIGLSLGDGGSNEQVAILIINNNYAAGFHITFTFTNKGKFKKGSKEITMTSLVLNKMSTGTLGSGITAPTNAPITLDGSGSWTWSSGAQTTETTNYMLEIKISWNGSSNSAGFYFENVTAAIAVGP